MIPADENSPCALLVESEQLGDGGANRCFHDSAAAVGQSQGGEHAAGLRIGADGSEPGRAVSRDQSKMGKRLDVLDQGWCPVDAAFEDPRRGEAGQGCTALDATGQG